MLSATISNLDQVPNNTKNDMNETNFQLTDTKPVIGAQVVAVDNSDQEIQDVLDLSQALASANNW